MKLFTGISILSVLPCLVYAAADDPYGLNFPSPLSVQLTPIAYALIKAHITNNGNSTLNLLNVNTILDKKPVQKLTGFSHGQPLDFSGIHIHLMHGALSPNEFTPLQPSQTIEVEINPADLFDLSAGGVFKFIAQGAVPVALVNSTAVVDNIEYHSNTVEMDIPINATGFASSADTLQAQKKKKIFENCSAEQREILEGAYENCASLAKAAAKQARSGGDTARFSQFFHSTSNDTRQKVAARFDAIAEHCTTYETSGYMADCAEKSTTEWRANVTTAETLGNTGAITFFDLYFEVLEDMSQNCWHEDQAAIVVHEVSHMGQVYSPGTHDYAYGVFSIELPTSKALKNADSYSLYAHEVRLQCKSLLEAIDPGTE